jgi:hypothetical protein
LAEWNARSAVPNTTHDLDQLRRLASAALANAREMFVWLVHPDFRQDLLVDRCVH